MMREMEQKKEFLAHQFQALKEEAETMGVQKNMISCLGRDNVRLVKRVVDFSPIRMSGLWRR